MYLDVIYEYEPTSVPYKEIETDFAGSYLAADRELKPNSVKNVELACTDFFESSDCWYTMDRKKCQGSLRILKKDWNIDFIEMQYTCMIIYLAHLTESRTKIRLCLSNK